MSPVPYFINPKFLGKLVAGKLVCQKFDMDPEGILSMAVFLPSICLKLYQQTQQVAI